ncbi:MAG: ERF family protein [Roseburia sp.]|nr:ERF family protein [Roseburia sp.]MBQ8279583.1 ERF family protein [Roseburia sp.]
MNVYEKLATVQQELIAPKNQYNKFGNYNYRSCEDILEGLKPLLQKVKAVVKITDEVVLIGDRYYIQATATFIDIENGESVSNIAYAREEENVKGMSCSQITGSASSYARKYALNGLFCIDDVKDADSRDNRQGEAIEQKKTEEQQQEIERMKISEVKVKSLQTRCEKEGVSIDKITRLYKVGNLAELTEKQFRNINDHWEDIKKVN